MTVFIHTMIWVSFPLLQGNFSGWVRNGLMAHQTYFRSQLPSVLLAKCSLIQSTIHLCLLYIHPWDVYIYTHLYISIYIYTYVLLIILRLFCNIPYFINHGADQPCRSESRQECDVGGTASHRQPLRNRSRWRHAVHDAHVTWWTWCFPWWCWWLEQGSGLQVKLIEIHSVTGPSW